MGMVNSSKDDTGDLALISWNLTPLCEWICLNAKVAYEPILVSDMIYNVTFLSFSLSYLTS